MADRTDRFDAPLGGSTRELGSGAGFTFAPPQEMHVTMFTDSHVIRGHIATRLRRLSDVLNTAEDDFIVVANATMEEFGARGQPDRADFAQVNLSTLLFAVADSIVEPQAELRLVKSQEEALVIVPPFKVVGRIHVLPGRDLREALAELTGRFIPVTDGFYWSETLREPRTSAPFVAVNHARAHVLASYRKADPWEGLSAR